jgi:hypothetical protein
MLSGRYMHTRSIPSLNFIYLGKGFSAAALAPNLSSYSSKSLGIKAAI